MLFENTITTAICVHVGYGRYSCPGWHLEDLEKKFGSQRAAELLPVIEEIRGFAMDIPFDPEDALSKIADSCIAAVKARYPKVGKRGRQALAWDVTFTLR